MLEFLSGFADVTCSLASLSVTSGLTTFLPIAVTDWRPGMPWDPGYTL